MEGRCRVFRASLAAILFMGFIWFLFVGVVASRVMRTTTITIQSMPKSSELLIAEESRHPHGVNWDLYPHSVSKRKVPNGPDPIHNRRAGKYREPPGRI